jgi:hypothetical protein
MRLIPPAASAPTAKFALESFAGLGDSIRTGRGQDGNTHKDGVDIGCIARKEVAAGTTLRERQKRAFFAEHTMNIPFSGWKKKDFARWLRANYPRPDSAPKDTSWLCEFRFHHPGDGNVVFEFTAKGVDYDACLGDLAAEMAIYAEEPLMNWEIFIRPR